ncbi:hypothetical protein GTO89_16525 [Heliobacterium gestii]|uniref:Apea-like HEPN domain-containing protein n=1 Tax=Heliomicrobium gestii TaxID=2699 RepID=A0A845LEN4_HELGE|nr:HEPN domain-containing protein [Heliomicrobium gestii]MBM7867313.1 hypothetical protein [Heliomicrobium gestii]MZP44628.1 hypothetical protein [Heliomicrobium gestii]
MQVFSFKTVVKGFITLPFNTSSFRLGDVLFEVEEEYRSNQEYHIVKNNSENIVLNNTFTVNDQNLDKKDYILYRISTAVKAENREIAHQTAVEKVNQRLDLISLLTKGRFDPVKTGITLSQMDNKKTRVASVDVTLIGVFDSETIHRLQEATRAMTWIDDNIRTRILKCIRFYRKGLLEKQPDVKFIFFMIALECLSKVKKSNKAFPVCKKCKNEITKCIHCHSETSYEPAEKTLIKELLVNDLKLLKNSEFNKLYKIRSSIIHGGNSISKKELNLIEHENLRLRELIPASVEAVWKNHMLADQVKDINIIEYWE